MSARLQPSISPDTEFFWNGVRERRLLIQRCAACKALRHPPRPMCPQCNSLAWDALPASGRGVVYSFVIPHHPKFPMLEYPYIVVLVELEEGVRIVSNLAEVEPKDVRVGLPVEVFFAEFDGGLVLPQFRLASR